MKYGMIVFPGGSAAPECVAALRHLGHDAELIWHGNPAVDPDAYDCLLLPPGHSYGDYLRPGAIAKLSPIMPSVQEYAAGGGVVVGFGNGFQILLEAGLLPGAMLINRSCKYVCRLQRIAVESTKSALTCGFQAADALLLPIAHRWGNYWVDDGTLERMEHNGQIVLVYGDPEPNGSLRGIAGICNESGNVVGTMAHFHRAVFEDLGSTDGVGAFASIASWVEKVRTGRNGRSAPSGRSEGSGRSVRDGHSARGGCCSCRGCDVAESAANMIAATSVEGGNARD